MSDKLDFTKVAYASYDEDIESADSHKISFHVRFLSNGDIDEVYALEMERGNDIGSRGKL